MEHLELFIYVASVFDNPLSNPVTYSTKNGKTMAYDNMASAGAVPGLEAGQNSWSVFLYQEPHHSDFYDNPRWSRYTYVIYHKEYEESR